MTYIYADSTAVLGPLSTFAEPHAFDLCALHRERLKVPNGWTVYEHDASQPNSEPSSEDLMAIADAVREVAKSELPVKSNPADLGRRGHLRVIPQNE